VRAGFGTEASGADVTTRCANWRPSRDCAEDHALGEVKVHEWVAALEQRDD